MRSIENGLEKLIRGRRSAKRSARAAANDLDEALALDDHDEWELDEPPRERDDSVDFRDSRAPMDLFLRGRL